MAVGGNRGSAVGMRLVAHHDLGGFGDGMQVVRAGDALYVGHTGTSGAGTTVLDVRDVAAPRITAQWRAPANSHSHKVQVANKILLVNNEKFPYRGPAAGPISAGIGVYSLEDPFSPEQIGFWSSGGRGVHRIVWDGGRYAHCSAIPEGFRDRIFVVLDMAEPAAPREIGRWWWPGLKEGEEQSWPAGERYAAHHAHVDGQYAYLGFDDAGLVVLDISDWTAPRLVGHLGWEGGATHTCLPLRSRALVVATDEQQRDGPRAPERGIRVIDVRDPRHPVLLAKLPPPLGDFAEHPMRFGAHNLHENQADAYRSDRLVFATYFSAGVRVYDLEDPGSPREIASFVPDAPAGQAMPQSNDLFVDATCTVWVTDRVTGGLSVLEPEPWLRELMEQARQ